jgi:hypothetical protein
MNYAALQASHGDVGLRSMSARPLPLGGWRGARSHFIGLTRSRHDEVIGPKLKFHSSSYSARCETRDASANAF